MAILHNRVSQTELKLSLLQEQIPRITLSFYQYFFINDTQKFRDGLYEALFNLNVLGRIYIASEGINAQVSVPIVNVEAFENYLNFYEPLKGIRLNSAVDDDGKSFWVLKIKVRSKIVSDGITDPAFSMEKKGKYVDAVQMNILMEEEDTIVIDMRNHYEFEVGHFDKAIEIPSDTFRAQLPMVVEMMQDKKDKNIIMYCTGGIRCEKASAYMLHNGFKNVFHLEGGVINYAKQALKNNLPSKFFGKNFVFDERLGERITNDIISHCHQCGKSADTHTNCKNEACHLLFIQCKECAENFNGCCNVACKTTYNLPIEVQKELRKGIEKDSTIFNKSKRRLRPKIILQVF